ncbi:hypothetical protein BV210_13245 [Halorientalis sp. IM1011]|uniref:DUF7553 family protein n=1 Tax=Halorientalis sp. IM1011 TaxID=1932360 RepID=UPI00097CC887|nr:hypothetical protein [Halorientalis sp. IM1011]AQL43603.1 hypothetical protein BV210_13245 [Halorientalis sp. IM1011]
MRQERTGIAKAHRQLLLASELTVDRRLAERLADLAHQVGELPADGQHRGTVRTIEAQLRDLGRDDHPDVRAAVDRARTLLVAYRDRPD